MDTNSTLDLMWLIPVLPLAGAAIILLIGKRALGEPGAGYLAATLLGGSFLLTLVSFLTLLGEDSHSRQYVVDLFTWIPVGSFEIDFGLLIDPLSITMLLFVTGVGTLIHIYAIGYMHGDPRFTRFFGYLNLFAASMIILVMGSNYLVTFLGWEGVGVCSYLLISFWFEKPSAATAGKKAFVTNRVGDFGLMLAMFLMLAHLGTLNYLSTSELAPTLASGTATAIALLLFLGAMGKSAQMPLHVWLPDAMEGPTPVSALIHAATMVTAGVFLLVRSHGFLEVSGDAGTIVAWVGGLTAFFAATVALTQYDIKRVLAYSTISQLGYLFLAVGVGAYVAAIFHMVTHAFFKALLFLGSGSVIHGMHDEQDMRYMGALRKAMPITAATFIVGWLAIAGVFPLSGFWSKDEILASAWFGDQPILWGLGIVTAILTAFYMTRQVVMVFFSPARWDNEDDLSRVATEIADEKGVQTAQLADDVEPDAEEPEAGKVPAPAHLAGKHPHESPRLMTVPLIVLAVLSFFGGILNLPFPGFHQLGHWLEPVIEPVVEGFQEPHPDSFNAGLMFALIALGGAVAGIALGWSTYKKYRGTDDPTIGRLGPLAAFLSNAWYFDAFYQKVIAEPGRKIALFLSRDVDSKLIDGLVNGVGKAFGFASVESGKAETGYVRQYALVLLAGTVVLITYAIVRAA